MERARPLRQGLSPRLRAPDTARLPLPAETMPLARLPFAVPLALLLAVAAAGPAAGSGPAPRLAGATEVDPPGKYPFAAALVDRHTADAWRGRFCDGAVVGDRWVLTAARCLEDRRPADVDVVVGPPRPASRRAASAWPRWPSTSTPATTAPTSTTPPGRVGRPRSAQPGSPAGRRSPARAGAGRRMGRHPRPRPPAAHPAAGRGAPALSDARCALIHGDAFSPASMVCAGDLDHGGVGACSGDRGAPLFVGVAGRAHPGGDRRLGGGLRPARPPGDVHPGGGGGPLGAVADRDTAPSPATAGRPPTWAPPAST